MIPQTFAAAGLCTSPLLSPACAVALQTSLGAPSHLMERTRRPGWQASSGCLPGACECSLKYSGWNVACGMTATGMAWQQLSLELLVAALALKRDSGSEAELLGANQVQGTIARQMIRWPALLDRDQCHIPCNTTLCKLCKLGSLVLGWGTLITSFSPWRWFRG